MAGVTSLYSFRWESPHPEWEVESIDFVSMKTGNTVPILVAISAEIVK